MNWQPTESFAVRLSDETGEKRGDNELEAMVNSIREVANEYGFDLCTYGGWTGMKSIVRMEDSLLRAHEKTLEPPSAPDSWERAILIVRDAALLPVSHYVFALHRAAEVEGIEGDEVDRFVEWARGTSREFKPPSQL